MQVKKYRAKTIDGATAKVKDDLGMDAMICSTKRIKGGFGDHMFEISAVPAGTAVPDAMGEIKSELVSIKEMIYLLNHSGDLGERLMMDPDVLNLYAKLIRNGVDDKYARIFLERGGAFKERPKKHANRLRVDAIREIRRMIRVIKPFEIDSNKRVISALIGTTGVGKTTTIAKLTAQLMLNAGKKVGLISIDGYRIGALEQLKTYANILGVPCFPAFNRKDLLFALKRLEGKDIVLIDTAGQSQYDMSRMEELKKMMTDNMDINCHLLLSAATSELEMSSTAINFSSLKYQSYIFTKIDETEVCGPIINQIMKLNLPVSFITTGQNVPEDIEAADREKIIKLLLRKKLDYTVTHAVNQA